MQILGLKGLKIMEKSRYCFNKLQTARHLCGLDDPVKLGCAGSSKNSSQDWFRKTVDSPNPNKTNNEPQL